jgi:hypothetical protein
MLMNRIASWSYCKEADTPGTRQQARIAHRGRSRVCARANTHLRNKLRHLCYSDAPVWAKSPFFMSIVAGAPSVHTSTQLFHDILFAMKNFKVKNAFACSSSFQWVIKHCLHRYDCQSNIIHSKTLSYIVNVGWFFALNCKLQALSDSNNCSCMSLQIFLIRLLRVSFDRGGDLSSSSYFFPCNISVILISTYIRVSPIVCSFLALVMNYASCDALIRPAFFYCLCSSSTLSAGRVFPVSSKKLKYACFYIPHAL